MQATITETVLMGSTDDDNTAVMMMYSRTHGKMIVMTAHYDDVAENYVNDPAHCFQTDSRAKAEDFALAVCREYDIPHMDEYEITITLLPTSREDLEIWVNPALPYLN